MHCYTKYIFFTCKRTISIKNNSNSKRKKSYFFCCIIFILMIKFIQTLFYKKMNLKPNHCKIVLSIHISRKITAHSWSFYESKTTKIHNLRIWKIKKDYLYKQKNEPIKFTLLSQFLSNFQNFFQTINLEPFFIYKLLKLKFI